MSAEAHSQRLADAFSSVLGKRTKTEVPILATVDTRAADKEEVEEKRQKRTDRKEAAQRKLLRSKDRARPESVIDEKEAVLRKIATRGVVKLFNAVTVAQRMSNEATGSERAKGVSKDEFLSMLQSGGQREKKPAEQAKAPKWEALQDNYMMQHTTLKHWDKDGETDESEEDEEEMENELEQERESEQESEEEEEYE